MGIALSTCCWQWLPFSVTDPSPSPPSSSSSSSLSSCYELDDSNSEPEETHGSSSTFSSSSSSSSSTKYDVFLNFSGRDTRHTFTSHLYHYLVRDGIQTFMDDEEIQKGQKIASELDKAIADSRISIPIFSLHYGSSKWCLNELVKIMECSTNGQTVLPIFYHVNPRDVRKQIGEFGEQFQKLTGKSTENETVERWREALRKAGELKGWHIDNGNESKLIQLVIKKVWRELRETSFDIPENLVGINFSVNALLNLLSLESQDVKIVGIWGMGGIGKTTLAKTVYEQIRHSFEGHIFLDDIREASKQPKGLVVLQNQLLSTLLKRKIQLINNASEGESFIKKCLHDKKVLIVLDDVDNIKQLKALAGRPDWFGPKSRIILTTRDEHVLNVHKVHGIYEAKELDFYQSLRLFSKHAFRNDEPPTDLLKLAEDVVCIAGGLPLALEILASFLSDKISSEVWRSTLDRLKKFPDKDIQQVLKISYDGLDDEDKEIFLDIVCFFVGTDKEHATDILEGCNFSAMVGIANLIQRSLIKIDYCNELRMHDLLRDMGRYIVHQESPYNPGKRSRLWSHQEVLTVLKRKAGTENIQGIVLKLGEETALEKIHISTEAFEKMSELRILQIDNVHLLGDFEKMPSELKWLSWKGCPLKSMPTDFCLEELGVLDLSCSRIKQVWNDLDQKTEFRKLKVLILSKCQDLIETPNFSRLPNLKILNLEDCVKLEELHGSICKLTSLKKLILSGCSNLNNVPELIGSRKVLEVIKFDGCNLICRSPNSIGIMRNLKTLSLDETDITELPDAVGLLEKIETLSVSRCSNLVKLPDSMGAMKLLSFLQIDETGIVKLPEDFGMLSSLEYLSMARCREFSGFPENFGSLVRLMELNVEGNSKLTMLPNSFSGLCSLERLFASSCCFSEDGIPSDFGKLSSLTWLDLSSNGFCSLPASISALSELWGLCLNNCRNLEYVPQIPSSLMELEVRNCKKLEEIQGIEELEQVLTLSMSGCSRDAVNYVWQFFDKVYFRNDDGESETLDEGDRSAEAELHEDGRELESGDDIWDVASEEVYFRNDDGESETLDEGDRSAEAELHEDGRELESGDDIWDVASEEMSLWRENRSGDFEAESSLRNSWEGI